jgi:hypothetical protein
MCGQRLLGRHRGCHGRRGAPEHREERVPFGPDVDAISLTDGVAKQTVVCLEDHLPSLTQGLEKPRGPLYVGEQERDSPGGQIGAPPCDSLRWHCRRALRDPLAKHPHHGE